MFFNRTADVAAIVITQGELLPIDSSRPTLTLPATPTKQAEHPNAPALELLFFPDFSYCGYPNGKNLYH